MKYKKAIRKKMVLKNRNVSNSPRVPFRSKPEAKFLRLLPRLIPQACDHLSEISTKWCTLIFIPTGSIPVPVLILAKLESDIDQQEWHDATYRLTLHLFHAKKCTVMPKPLVNQDIPFLSRFLLLGHGDHFKTRHQLHFTSSWL